MLDYLFINESSIAGVAPVAVGAMADPKKKPLLLTTPFPQTGLAGRSGPAPTSMFEDVDIIDFSE